MNSETVFRELVTRAWAGDPVALGELLENYHGHLRQIAENLLDDRVGARIDASDLVQQRCLSVHKRMAEFDGHDAAQFAAWLRKIHERSIQNAVRDQLHVAKRAINREERLGDADLEAIQTSPSQHAVRSEESERLTHDVTPLAGWNPRDRDLRLARRSGRLRSGSRGFEDSPARGSRTPPCCTAGDRREAGRVPAATAAGSKIERHQ